MPLALFTICLISGIYGSEAGGGQCKISERSFPGKALKGHTFKEFAVRAIVLLFSLPLPPSLFAPATQAIRILLDVLFRLFRFSKASFYALASSFMTF